MKFRTLLFPFIIALILSACSSPEKPEFKKLENVRFKTASIQKMSVTLKANAVLFNPNALGANISAMDFDVYANDKKVTHIRQTVRASIPANSDFKLPVEFDIPIKDIIKDIKPSITNILNSKKLKYKIDGNLTVNLAGADIKVPITYEGEEEIKLGL